MESLYPSLQGIPSHAVHGTWVDLVLHHLEVVDLGFRPKPDSMAMDVRLLCPIGIAVLTAIRSYVVENFSKGHEGVLALHDRIDDLIERSNKVDAAHEVQLSRESL